MEITEQHKNLVLKTWEKLNSWRSFLIAVDGKDGSGKSTLARFLSWQMGMPTIETDLFLDRGQNEIISYKKDDMRRIIKTRLDNDRPVIVEGIFLLDVLQTIQIEPDYVIYTENQGSDGSYIWQEDFVKYEEEYTPRRRAGFVFSWSET
jgi:hypothetical protein